MIQRKQTLFLLLVIISSVALAIVNCNLLDINGAKMGVSVFIIPSTKIQPNIWHYVGSALDFISILLALITIFLYKNRNLQVKLCYGLMLLQLALTLIVSFCPVVALTETITYENTGFASIIGVTGMMGAYLAARYIKKDIELLKSAERIR